MDAVKMGGNRADLPFLEAALVLKLLQEKQGGFLSVVVERAPLRAIEMRRSTKPEADWESFATVTFEVR